MRRSGKRDLYKGKLETAYRILCVCIKHLYSVCYQEKIHYILVKKMELYSGLQDVFTRVPSVKSDPL